MLLITLLKFSFCFSSTIATGIDLNFSEFEKFPNAREKNVGWRIDYFIVSKSIEIQIQDSMIYSEVLGSDHCPIGLEIKI